LNDYNNFHGLSYKFVVIYTSFTFNYKYFILLGNFSKVNKNDVSVFYLINDFIENYSTFKPENLLVISRLFQNHLLEDLEEAYGYNIQVLKLCAWVILSTGIDLTKANLNSTFWKVNNLRLDQNYEVFEDWIKKIDEIEKNITKILKEISENVRTCFVCKKNEVSVLYLPCGHLVICSKCLNPNERHWSFATCTSLLDIHV